MYIITIIACITNFLARTSVSPASSDGMINKTTGAKIVVAACENCRLQIGDLNEHYGLDVHITALTDLVVHAMRLQKPLPGREAAHLFEGEKVSIPWV